MVYFRSIAIYSNTQRGFTLLEVLIALSLLTLALLLSAYPLYKAKTAMHDALMSTYASIVAEDAATRIQLNTNIHQNNGTNYTDVALWNTSAANTCTLICTPQQKMYTDAYELQTMWQQFSPQARMRITNCHGALCAFLWWESQAYADNSCIASQCIMFTFMH